MTAPPNILRFAPLLRELREYLEFEHEQHYSLLLACRDATDTERLRGRCALLKELIDLPDELERQAALERRRAEEQAEYDAKRERERAARRSGGIFRRVAGRE